MYDSIPSVHHSILFLPISRVRNYWIIINNSSDNFTQNLFAVRLAATHSLDI